MSPRHRGWPPIDAVSEGQVTIAFRGGAKAPLLLFTYWIITVSQAENYKNRLGFNMLQPTPSEAIRTQRLDEFIAREEARGAGPVDRKALDAAIKKLATTARRATLHGAENSLVQVVC